MDAPSAVKSSPSLTQALSNGSLDGSHLATDNSSLTRLLQSKPGPVSVNRSNKSPQTNHVPSPGASLSHVNSVQHSPVNSLSSPPNVALKSLPTSSSPHMIDVSNINSLGVYSSANTVFSNSTPSSGVYSVPSSVGINKTTNMMTANLNTNQVQFSSQLVNGLHVNTSPGPTMTRNSVAVGNMMHSGIMQTLNGPQMTMGQSLPQMNAIQTVHPGQQQDTAQMLSLNSQAPGQQQTRTQVSSKYLPVHLALRFGGRGSHPS